MKVCIFTFKTNLKTNYFFHLYLHCEINLFTKILGFCMVFEKFLDFLTNIFLKIAIKKLNDFRLIINV